MGACTDRQRNGAAPGACGSCGCGHHILMPCHQQQHGARTPIIQRKGERTAPPSRLSCMHPTHKSTCRRCAPQTTVPSGTMAVFEMMMIPSLMQMPLLMRSNDSHTPSSFSSLQSFPIRASLSTIAYSGGGRGAGRGMAGRDKRGQGFRSHGGRGGGLNVWDVGSAEGWCLQWSTRAQHLIDR